MKLLGPLLCRRRITARVDRQRGVDAAPAGPRGERLAGRHVIGVQADAVALAVERLEARPDRPVLERMVDRRAVVLGVAVRVGRVHVALLADRAVGRALGRDGVAVEVVVQVLRGAAVGRPHVLAVGELVGALRADPVVLACGLVEQRALRAAGLVGRGEVLGRERPEHVPVVADRHVRAEVAQLRLQRHLGVGQAAQRADRRGRLGEVAQRVHRALQILVELHRAPRHRRADLERAVERRQRARQLARGGVEVAAERGGVLEERALDLQRLGRDVERRGLLGDRVLQRLRIARPRLERVGHLGEQVRVDLRDRRDDLRRRPELLEEVLEVGVRVREVRHHRLQVPEQRRRGLDEAAEVLAAAGERVAEALQVDLRGAPRLSVEHVVELVELDRDARLALRQHAAVRDRLLRAALRELDVLQAERRTRPDLD
ncbi:MAG: hypothetical protein E6G41_14880, partial [Actinobacteria bacterium]